MSEFSFLDYLNQYSQENAQVVKNAAQFKSNADLAKYLGFSKDSIDDWFTSGVPRKIPSDRNWNLALCMLEAKRKGYASLDELVKFAKNK